MARYLDGYIKTGDYTLYPPLKPLEIWDLVVAGRQETLRITFPEGITLSRMGEILEEGGICLKADFLTEAEGLEGYLYPDTYLFEKNYPASAVVKYMQETFYQRLSSIEGFAEMHLSEAELRERVIMASIVENEYRAADEAALMAGVFYKRLAIGMPLQSCATVVYVITEIQGKPHPSRILTADTRIDNPYNTYIHQGLPPGPICEPGLVALSAALHPVETDYLYFRLVDQSAGRHYFSSTFDEHIAAAALFTKGGD
jgi:UPF0755 protein